MTTHESITLTVTVAVDDGIPNVGGVLGRLRNSDEAIVCGDEDEAGRSVPYYVLTVMMIGTSMIYHNTTVNYL